MTTIVLMQKADTLLLVMITLSSLIIFREDREASWPCRMAWIILGFGSLAQAAWLQSYWWPNAAGYPWGGLVRDLGFALFAVLRTFTVLQRCHTRTRSRVPRKAPSA